MEWVELNKMRATLAEEELSAINRKVSNVFPLIRKRFKASKYDELGLNTPV